MPARLHAAAHARPHTPCLVKTQKPHTIACKPSQIKGFSCGRTLPIFDIAESGETDASETRTHPVNTRFVSTIVSWNTPTSIPAVHANSKVRWRFLVRRFSVTSPLQVETCSVRPACCGVCRFVLWRERGVPCYGGARVDGLDVTHSVAVARAGRQTVGSGHPRTTLFFIVNLR